MKNTFLVVALFIVFSSCTDSGFMTVVEIESVEPYDDIRWKDLYNIGHLIDSTMIRTFWFNEKTVWPDEYVDYAATVLEMGKNPGLGIRSLHQQGITGKGVNVAIIDQNICLDHPEFVGKVTKYHDVGCNQPKNESSMHGPAVLSLLVGEKIGTAPEARVFFAAAPSWTADAKYQADALLWIVEENKKLPVNEKIRVVSLSGSPSGPGSPFTKNNADWDSARVIAEQEDILILDCTRDHGITAPCYYDIHNPDILSKVSLGWPEWIISLDSTRLYVPTSLRSLAEEYEKGKCAYQFDGQGGLSWAEPYLAGVMAMGWQLKPELSKEEMVELIFKSAYIKDGYKIVNPVTFIDSVRAR